jgi:hypothetical protein
MTSDTTSALKADYDRHMRRLWPLSALCLAVWLPLHFALIFATDLPLVAVLVSLAVYGLALWLVAHRPVNRSRRAWIASYTADHEAVMADLDERIRRLQEMDQ